MSAIYASRDDEVTAWMQANIYPLSFAPRPPMKARAAVGWNPAPGMARAVCRAFNVPMWAIMGGRENFALLARSRKRRRGR